LYGDQVLRDTANILKASFRDTDIIGRIVGDEFMILIKNIESENIIAHKVSRVLRYINTVHNITASVGIAIYPKDGDTFEELYHNADLAMYKAKSQRKNRFVFYDRSISD
ncbi:MAG: GGDEF domain-containing protein, partial [Clostridiales bacterium]|nr:GGDEF domain-containing protein [Clostridiales bacterium]